MAQSRRTHRNITHNASNLQPERPAPEGAPVINRSGPSERRPDIRRHPMGKRRRLNRAPEKEDVVKELQEKMQKQELISEGLRTELSEVKEQVEIMKLERHQKGNNKSEYSEMKPEAELREEERVRTIAKVDGLSMRVDKLMEAVKEMQRDNVELKEGRAKRVKSLDEYLAILERKEEEYLERIGRLDKFENEQKKKLASLEMRVKDISKRIMATELEVKDLKLRKQAQNNDSNTKNSADGAEQVQAAIEATCAPILKKVESLAKDLANAKETNGRAHEEVAKETRELQTKIDELSARCRSQQTCVRDLAKQLDSSKNKLTKLSKELQVSDKKWDDLRRQVGIEIDKRAELARIVDDQGIGLNKTVTDARMWAEIIVPRLVTRMQAAEDTLKGHKVRLEKLAGETKRYGGETQGLRHRFDGHVAFAREKLSGLESALLAQGETQDEVGRTVQKKLEASLEQGLGKLRTDLDALKGAAQADGHEVHQQLANTEENLQALQDEVMVVRRSAETKNVSRNEIEIASLKERLEKLDNTRAGDKETFGQQILDMKSVVSTMLYDDENRRRKSGKEGTGGFSALPPGESLTSSPTNELDARSTSPRLDDF